MNISKEEQVSAPTSQLLDESFGLPIAFGKQSGKASDIPPFVNNHGLLEKPGESSGTSNRGAMSGRGPRGVVGAGRKNRGNARPNNVNYQNQINALNNGQGESSVQGEVDAKMKLNEGVKRPHSNHDTSSLPAIPSSLLPGPSSLPPIPITSVQQFQAPPNFSAIDNSPNQSPYNSFQNPSTTSSNGYRNPRFDNQRGFTRGRGRGRGRDTGFGGRNPISSGHPKYDDHSPSRPDGIIWKDSFLEDPWRELLEAEARHQKI